MQGRAPHRLPRVRVRDLWGFSPHERDSRSSQLEQTIELDHEATIPHT